MLVPRMLRARGPDARIAFFLHVPFPPTEVWARLPWSEQLLDGLLGATHVGFQTQRFPRQLLPRSALLAGLATRWRDDGCCCRRPDRRRRRAPDLGRRRRRSPSGRAGAGRRRAALRTLRDQFRGRRRAARRRPARLHEGHPGAAARVRVPARASAGPARTRRARADRGPEPGRRSASTAQRASRSSTPSAASTAGSPPRAASRSDPLHVPQRPPEQLLASTGSPTSAWSRRSNDGMNLVAKEYVAAQAAGDGDGVLVLAGSPAPPRSSGARRCSATRSTRRASPAPSSSRSSSTATTVTAASSGWPPTWRSTTSITGPSGTSAAAASPRRA